MVEWQNTEEFGTHPLPQVKAEKSDSAKRIAG
jgi:hypothetical protein